MPLKTHPRDMEKGFCPNIPTIFISLEQAKNSLDYQWNSCIQFLNRVEGDWGATRRGSISRGPLDIVESTEMIRQEMFNAFQRWLVAFRAFMQSRGRSLNSRGLQAARSLEISYCIGTIFLDVSTVQMDHDELVWDTFTKRFEQIINLATSIVESSSCDKSTQKRGADFSLDMHTVGPLYAVAIGVVIQSYVEKPFHSFMQPHARKGSGTVFLPHALPRDLLALKSLDLVMSHVARTFPTGHVCRMLMSNLIYTNAMALLPLVVKGAR